MTDDATVRKEIRVFSGFSSKPNRVGRSPTSRRNRSASSFSSKGQCNQVLII
jgi:hypothetical protein